MAGTIKALSLKQPWATLVVIGAKTIETRSWMTRHRTTLAIHSSGALDTDDRALCYTEPFRSALRKGGLRSPADLPTGCVLGVVKVLDVTEITPQLIDILKMRPTWPLEEAFGGWAPGRHAWMLKLLQKFTHPVAARGYPGLWDWEPPPGWPFATSVEPPCPPP